MGILAIWLYGIVMGIEQYGWFSSIEILVVGPHVVVLTKGLYPAFGQKYFDQIGCGRFFSAERGYGNEFLQ